VASGGADNTIRVFEQDTSLSSDPNSPNYKMVASVTSAHGTADVNCVQWYPSEKHGDLLASAGDDGVVRIWRLCC